MGLRRWQTLHQFVADKTGGMAALGAAGLFVATAAGALAVDVGKIYAIRAELETTADAAALAAATKLPNLDAARDMAIAYAERNMPVDKYGQTVAGSNVRFGNWDSENRAFSETTERPSAVQVKASFTLSEANRLGMIFAPIFGLDSFEVSADAVAGKASPPCIVSLGTFLPKAVRVQDSAHIEAVGCALQVNNERSIALEVSGSGRIEADATCVSGGVSIVDAGQAFPYPEEYCPQSADPLAHLQPLDSSVCTNNNMELIGGVHTLLPGTYCGGLKIRDGAQVTFLSGEYIIKNGVFSVKNNSSITGENVGFFFDGLLSLIYFDNDVDIDLSAPTSGPLDGLLFYQTRNLGGLHIWNSNRPSNLTGTIYLPKGQIVSESNSLLTPVNSCSVVIAARISLKNNSGLSIDISDSNCTNLLPAPFRKTVSLLD